MSSASSVPTEKYKVSRAPTQQNQLLEAVKVKQKVNMAAAIRTNHYQPLPRGPIRPSTASASNSGYLKSTQACNVKQCYSPSVLCERVIASDEEQENGRREKVQSNNAQESSEADSAVSPSWASSLKAREGKGVSFSEKDDNKNASASSEVEGEQKTVDEGEPLSGGSVIGVLPDGRHLVTLQGNGRDGVVVGGKKVYDVDIGRMLDVPFDVAKHTVLDIRPTSSERQSKTASKLRDRIRRSGVSGGGNRSSNSVEQPTIGIKSYVSIDRPSSFVSSTTTLKENTQTTTNSHTVPLRVILNENGGVSGQRHPDASSLLQDSSLDLNKDVTRKTIVTTTETTITTVTKSRLQEPRFMGKVRVNCDNPVDHRQKLRAAMKEYDEQRLSSSFKNTSPLHHDDRYSSSPQQQHIIRDANFTFSSSASSLLLNATKMSDEEGGAFPGVCGHVQDMNLDSTLGSCSTPAQQLLLDLDTTEGQKSNTHAGHFSFIPRQRPLSATSRNGNFNVSYQTSTQYNNTSNLPAASIGHQPSQKIHRVGPGFKIRRQFPCGFGNMQRRSNICEEYRKEHIAFV